MNYLKFTEICEVLEESGRSDLRQQLEISMWDFVTPETIPKGMSRDDEDYDGYGNPDLYDDPSTPVINYDEEDVTTEEEEFPEPPKTTRRKTTARMRVVGSFCPYQKPVLYCHSK